MEQVKSKRDTSRDMVLAQQGRDMYSVALSFDKKSELLYQIGTDVVTIGTRCHLQLLPTDQTGNNSITNLFKRWGVVIGTRGNRFARNAMVIVRDYYRFHQGKYVKRNRHQGSHPNTWNGQRGPAEASGALRIGDILYAINGRMIVNKSKGQILRMLKSILLDSQCSTLTIFNSLEW